jgi:hypothetical protein
MISDMADVLHMLFGSSLRVRLLRLFLFHQHHSFTAGEAAQRTRARLPQVKKELLLLERAHILFSDGKRGKTQQFRVNRESEYLEPLENLVLDAPLHGQEIADRLKGVGVLKLIMTSGVFLKNSEAALDLLVVGDRIDDRKLSERMRAFEAEIGKELRYAYLSTGEFYYRLNMNDRLIRDILDFPHQVVLDRLEMGLE